MEEKVISRAPLVRVNAALGRLPACEHLPLHVFRADGKVASRPRQDHRAHGSERNRSDDTRSGPRLP